MTRESMLATNFTMEKLNAGLCDGGITSALAGTATKDTIVNAIANSVDTNQYIRDIQGIPQGSYLRQKLEYCRCKSRG